MDRRVSALTVALLLVPPGAVATQSRSAVASFPSGATAHRLFTAAQEVLEHDGYTVEESIADQRLKASATVYDSVSTVSSATAKTTLTWTVELRTEGDGRIALSLENRVSRARPFDSIPSFARRVATEAGVAPVDATLTLDGVTKPLSDWKDDD
jgi:hypothetical protein